MKGHELPGPNQRKQKKDPYTKKDYDFLKDQKEERVHVTDYLTKDKSSGPWEKETEPTKKQRQEMERANEVDHNVGAKMDGARDFLRLESVKRGKIQN
jgi:hypothetical protein